MDKICPQATRYLRRNKAAGQCGVGEFVRIAQAISRSSERIVIATSEPFDTPYKAI